MGLGTRGQSKKNIWESKSHWTHCWNQKCSPPLSQLLPNSKASHPHRNFIFKHEISTSAYSFAGGKVQNHLHLASTKQLGTQPLAQFCQDPGAQQGYHLEGFFSGCFPHITGNKSVYWWEVERDCLCITWGFFFLHLLNCLSLDSWVFLTCALPILSPIPCGGAVSRWGLSCWLGSTHHSKRYLIF